MASPKVICKSGYTRKAKHFANSLNYAGNKIEGQLLVYKDGSMRSVHSDKAITLTDIEANDLLYIEMAYKDGGSDRLDYETYKNTFVQSVTVNELTIVLDEPGELGKSYHDLQDLDFIKYTQYVAERPGVEKSAEGHGLFGLNGDVDINEALTEADEYIESTKWMHILSLPEGEDIRTGFNKREMWQALVAAKAPQISKLYNISLENLVIYGGFHSNTDNAHCHLMFYSKDKTEGFIPGGTEKLEQASRKLSSLFLNEIYKDDIAVLNREKNIIRDQFTQQLNQQLTTLKHKHTVAPQLIEKLQILSNHLKSLPGKHEYGYLPSSTKSIVNDLLKDFISIDSDLQKIYQSFVEVQKSYIENYVASPQKIAQELKEFERDFFAPPKNSLRIYHNAIVRYADLLADATHVPTSLPDRTEQRTDEGEISEHIPDDSCLSSLMDTLAPPDRAELRTAEREISEHIPDDGYLSSLVDSIAPPDRSEQRTTEGKIADYIPDDGYLSSLVDSIAPPDQSEQRTTEGKIADFIPDNAYLSSMKPKTSPQAKNLTFYSDNFIMQNIIKSKEHTAALNKALYKSLYESLGSLDALSSQYVLQSLNKTGSNPDQQEIGSILKSLYTSDPKFQQILDNHVGNIYNDLKQKSGAQKAQNHLEEYKAILFSSAAFLPSHTLVYYFSQNLKEHLYINLIKSEKSVFNELTKEIRKTFDVTIDQLPTEVREAFVKLCVETDSTLANKLRLPIIAHFLKGREKAVEGNISKLMEKAAEMYIAKPLRVSSPPYIDANDQLMFERQIRQDIYSASSPTPLAFLIDNLSVRYALKDVQHLIDEHFSKLYLSLSANYCTNKQKSTTIDQMIDRFQKHKKGHSKEIDNAYAFLSDKNFDFAKNHKLIVEAYVKQSSYDTKQANTLIEKHLHDQAKYMLSNFDGGEVLRRHNKYVLHQAAKSLLHNLGRLLCMQAMTTHQHNAQTQKTDDRSKESKQLFKTQKFKQQSFERPEQSISY